MSEFCAVPCKEFRSSRKAMPLRLFNKPARSFLHCHLWINVFSVHWRWLSDWHL